MIENYRRAPGPILHFVGFKDDRIWAALRLFGAPDFYHLMWDERAKAEIMPDDIAIFAAGGPADPTVLDYRGHPISWDDSQQDIVARGGREFV